MGETDVLQHFGYFGNGETFGKIKILPEYLSTNSEAAFIYSNIVGQSSVDGEQSRLMACAHLKTTDAGYSYHEFQNPQYHPLRVNSFTDISFQLRDVRGKLINIAHKEKHEEPLKISMEP